MSGGEPVMVQPTPPAPSSGNTSAGTGAAAAPLAGFDPVGTGAVISYQVPEPTSYTGRDVLTLNYDLTDFPKVINASAGNAPGNDGSGQGQLPPALAPSSSAPLTTTGTQT